VNLPPANLEHGGPAILFAAEFIEQIGVPLPASPWLLAGGVLIGSGKLNWLAAVAAATFGSLLPDLFWFYLGRHSGHRVLNLLCRISLEPDACVRQTKDLYTRYGAAGLVFAKFVPGLSTLAPPLAGYSGLSTADFLLFDGFSSLLHAGGFILVGFLFRRQLEQILRALAGLGAGALVLLAGSVLLYLGYKYFNRQRLLKQLRMARITVDELRQKQMAGEQPVILDLRSMVELERDPSLISGALHMSLEELQRRNQEIPRDRDIILYCSCPNEVTSARVALQLRQEGVLRVRPLLGGFDAWRKRNYPTELKAGGKQTSIGHAAIPNSMVQPPVDLGTRL
jgi:membrane protein DedA with SNARE-associated domain